MSNNPQIPGADLPLATPGATDTVLGVDESSRALRRFRRDSFPLSAADHARLQALEAGQSADMLGFTTKALMDASLAHTANTLAVVTNDSAAENNGTYIKLGASGSGSWQKSADRLTALEGKLSANLKFTALAPESGYAWGLVDSNNRAAMLVKLDGSVEFPKFSPVLMDGSVARAKLHPSVEGLIPVTMARDTGYAWALVDSEDRAAILVGLDGTVYLPKYDRAEFIATALDPQSGYVWAVVDSAGRIALGVKTNGKVVGKLADLNFANADRLTANSRIWCLGDSMTPAVASRLSAVLTDRMVTNAGIGGQTSPQIAARAGAGMSLLTLAGNSIPASGAVNVTALSNRLLSTAAAASGTTTLKGWIGGIHGTLTCTHDTGNVDASDAYTFTRTSAGTASYVQPKSPFIPDVSGNDYGTAIIFVGNNNASDTAQVKTDIDAIVEVMKTIKRQFLIIPPVNGGPKSGASSPVASYIVELEDWAAAKYGDNVIKVREWSFQFNNGSADDLADVANGVVPRSLRTDTIHWTATFSNQVGDLIASEINRKGF